jgi:hypothetical protein
LRCRGVLGANIPVLADGSRMSLTADRNSIARWRSLWQLHDADSVSAVIGCWVMIPGARNRVEVVGLVEAVGERASRPIKPRLAPEDQHAYCTQCRV